MPREITEWDWYCDANTFRVFMHLIICAHHVPEVWRGVKVDRGQVVTGREALAKALCMSPQEVRTALDKLRLSGDITSKPTSKFSIITICKYEDYNGADICDQPANQPATAAKSKKLQTETSAKQSEKVQSTNKPTIEIDEETIVCGEQSPAEQPAKLATSNPTNNPTNKSTSVNNEKTSVCGSFETREQPALQPALQPQRRIREVENTTTTKTTTRPKRVNALDLEVLPQALRRDVILAFVESRKALRKPLTQRALLMCCKDAMRCQELHGIDPNDAMEKAIGKGWMTCDPEYFSSQKKSGKPSTGSDKHSGFSEKDYGAGGLI